MKLSTNIFFKPFQITHDGLILRMIFISAIWMSMFIIPIFDISTYAQTGWSTTFTDVFRNDFEQDVPEDISGFYECCGRLEGREPIEGNISIRFGPGGNGIMTNPDEVSLAPNTIYSVEYDYHIAKQKPGESLFWNYFVHIPGGNDGFWISPGRTMEENAERSGTYSGGSLLGDGKWQFGISSPSSDVIIDNFALYRSDPFEISEQPNNWKFLKFTPFPRLGNYLSRGPSTSSYFQDCKDGKPYQLTVNEYENKVAFSDVVVGFRCTGQDPDFARRMRERNAGIILLSYEHTWEIGAPGGRYYEDISIDVHEELLSGMAEEWFVKDTSGNTISIPDWLYINTMKMTNMSEHCPTVNGLTWNDYNLSYIVNRVSKLGIWDGVLLNFLYGHIHPGIPYYNDPSLLDFDINLNGLRDETPALISDITRNAATKFLERIRDEFGDLEIIMGNTGAKPETALAPYVNGYVFQCWSDAWYYDETKKLEGEWRNAIEGYFQILSNTVSPKIVITEGCGSRIGWPEKDNLGCGLTGEDFQTHRFMMGSTLLGDGFYEYDLWECWSAPHWFDEYTVNENGVAVEDRKYKGYLGQPLGDAVELKAPAMIIWEEDFESGTIPDEMSGDPGTYVSKEQDDVISGEASLIIHQPDHSKVSYTGITAHSEKIPFESGKTYLIEFDWLILETIDGEASVSMNGSNYSPSITLPGVVAGDTGKTNFPVTLDSEGQYSFSFSLNHGGGKVAIDNIRVNEGGVGPWRRDFENGFVLVNPLNKPYSFTSTELSGTFNRSQIKRILGTQDPTVNNGQPVTESLTLLPFDAIILLAGINQLPVSFSVSPDTCAYDRCEIGSSTSQTITITNTSELSLQLINKLENTSDDQHFSIINDTCNGSSIDPLNNCIVQIMFSPKSAGTKSAKFTIRADESGTSSLDVELSGEAISPPSRKNGSGGGGGGGGCFIDTLRY